MLNMNINKAIRKQIKSYKRFVLIMCFVFFVLPVFPFIYNKATPFYLGFLAVIEAMIVASVVICLGRLRIKFAYERKGRIKVKYGLAAETINIYCSKVMYVDIEVLEPQINRFEDFKIIVLTNSRFKSKKLKKVGYDFMKKYTLTAYQYNKLKVRNPEDEYYYFIIGSGGLKKYELLSTIYSTCVHAGFSEAAIEKIKLYRDSQL